MIRVNVHDGEGLVELEQLQRGTELHVQRWTLAPGVTEGVHTHGHDTVGDEAYYVLSGRLTVVRGSSQDVLEPGESVLLSPDEPRGLRNDGSEDAVVLVVFTASRGQLPGER